MIRRFLSKHIQILVLAIGIVLAIALFAAGSTLANSNHQPVQITNPNQYLRSTPFLSDTWHFYEHFPALVLLISVVFVGLETLRHLAQRTRQRS